MSYLPTGIVPSAPSLDEEKNEEIEFVTIHGNNPYIPIQQIESGVYSNNQLLSRPLNNNSLACKTIKIANSTFSLMVSDELYEKIIKLEHMDCYVKFICMADFILNLFYFLYGYYYAVILAFISLYGYYSTISHKKHMLCAYLYYQYMLTIGKILQFILCCFLLNKDFREKFEETYPLIYIPNHVISLFVYSSFLLLCQLYITAYINRYYNLLPNKNDSNNIYVVRDDALLV